ncbi:MAG: HrgA protein [Alcaligenaceae bacterium]|nr:HrgA protein [Alcaligenaceae bacterium]
MRDNPGKKFTARELAHEFVKRYPQEIAEKRTNPRYATLDDLIFQLSAEIGGERTAAAKQRCPNVVTQDQPRPRLYYWDDNPQASDYSDDSLIEVTTDETQDIATGEETSFIKPQSFQEYELYPLLIEFLSTELKLYCQRIDEKKSKNSYGSGGNRWLHPDVVALEPLDKHWDPIVRDCVRHGNDSSIRLWSFEVKKQLTRCNVREFFFQTVSNSSWANFAYLVATGMNNDVETKLQMLSSLHAVDVLYLSVFMVCQSMRDYKIL